MNAQTLTPTVIFGLPCQYTVPLFQRPYVWNEEDQWRPLWQDVVEVAEHLLEASWEGGAVGGHFLGAIVLDQQFVPVGSVPQRNVIDGQQRLTTLQLLLDAADSVVQEYGDADDRFELGRLVVNKGVNPARPDDRFKVWPTDRDQPAFRAAMADELPTDGYAQSRIVAAHEFFRANINEWALDEGPENAAARLGALTKALTQYLKLVVIDLEAGDNPQVIFEALNHRGAPLLAADLVKNRIFQQAQEASADVHALHEEHWKPFDGDAWRRKVSQGRLFRPRIDLFMNYWLALQLKRMVNVDRIYEAYLEFEKDHPLPAEVLLPRLARAGHTFDSFDSFQPHTVEGDFSYRVLDVMQASIWGPILMYLFDDEGGAVPIEQRSLALRAIESWAVRRMVCRLTTKAVNQVAIDLLRKLLGGEKGAAGAITVDHLKASSFDSNRWPGDSEVQEAVLTQPLYTGLSRARVRMLLEALEDALRSPKTEQPHCVRGQLTIEHVLPQSWDPYWPRPADGSVSESQRNRLLHTLGNLTLVTKKLNPALSNYPWTEAGAASYGVNKCKQVLLEEHSDLRLTKHLLKTWPEEWNEITIAERGVLLSERLITIWPSAEALE